MTICAAENVDVAEYPKVESEMGNVIWTRMASWLFTPSVPVMAAWHVLLPESGHGAGIYRLT